MTQNNLETTSVIPNIIDEISLYLKDTGIVLSSPLADGRINASINEDEIIKTIQRKYTIQVPKSRAWYDFAIENNNEFFPVNIKVTDTTHADNLNCKLGIYYSLTGLMPNFPNETSWLEFF